MDEATRSEIARLDAENTRQNRRLEKIDERIENLSDLAMSVQKLALNMEQMLKEQVDQGNRLKVLEDKPAEAWNSLQKTVFTTIVGAIAGGLAVGIMQMISMGA